ncbi:MAG: hypothetical protein LC793_12305 [Thermomicrobia bacterium]|nr:hypothetical protein [Thermomicrobia bacterium]MCA1722648.1 hypothetical protein [Thermomicrobia bacterium]
MPLDLAATGAVRTRFITAAGLSLVETLTEVVFPVADADVPRDTETLAQSARISQPTEDANGIAVSFSYGVDDDENPKSHQPSNAYAVMVHEEIGKQHPGGGSAKWLEGAMTQTAARFADEVAKRMRPRM